MRLAQPLGDLPLVCELASMDLEWHSSSCSPLSSVSVACVGSAGAVWVIWSDVFVLSGPQGSFGDWLTRDQGDCSDVKDADRRQLRLV